jgi:uncharacterized protein
MKRLLLAIAFGACGIAGAQSLPDADPALWVAKDKDTTLYLFGTFHLLDGKSDWFNDEVKTAFDASQEVVLEAVPPENPLESQSLVVKYAMDPAGKTLSSKLPPEVKKKLDEQLAMMGIPAAALEPMEPWFVTTMLSVLSLQKLGLDGELGAEAVIGKAAAAAGKSLSALESVELQLRMFDQLPEPLQVEMLRVSLDQLDEMEDVLKPLLAAWYSGDIETFTRIFNEELNDSPELYDILLTRRNTAWAEWIDQRMDKPGTVFIAVGAGHLAGKDNVQDLLKARGIEAVRVRP